MKRLAVSLSGCMIAGCVGCSGPGTAPPPPHLPAKVTATPSPGSPGASSPTIPHPGQTVAAVAVAVVTNYYRAIVARDYRRAFTYLAAKATGPAGHPLTWPEFLRLADMLDNEWGPVTYFSVGGFPAMVVMTAERQKISLYHAHLQMAHYKDGWAITSIDRI